MEASDLRSAPSSSGKLLFFTHTLCPYAQRVWIALQEKVRLQRRRWMRCPTPSPERQGGRAAGQLHLTAPHCLCTLFCKQDKPGQPQCSRPNTLNSHTPPLQEVPYTLVHVDLSDKPAWFRSVNPRGLVPAVQYDGQTVTESTDICRWVSTGTPGRHTRQAV